LRPTGETLAPTEGIYCLELELICANKTNGMKPGSRAKKDSQFFHGDSLYLMTNKFLVSTPCQTTHKLDPAFAD
jgi:hypothetical protein